jgi:cholera toxin transcriptional activator
MPVADQSENQNEHTDNQNARSFLSVDVVSTRSSPGRVIRLWAGFGHASIVAPKTVQRRVSDPPLAVAKPRQRRSSQGRGLEEDCRASLALDGSLRLRSGQAPARPHTVRAGNKFASAKLRAAVSMPQRSPAGRIVRFGVFEIDLAAGELRKNGARIRLQEQPFQILVFLSERPGEAVTREELRRKLWPSDTFVDFDHSLNTAVNKLREALGDSASSPRYVETLARRGYRFLAAVEHVEPNSVPDSTKARSIDARLAAATKTFHRGLEVPLPQRSLTRGLFALIQVMYLTFYVAALFGLTEIERITSTFLPGWGSLVIFVAVLVTAGVGIPLRFYLISAAAFDHQRLGEKFQRMFLVIMVLDQLWAVAPFLMTHKIGFGAAFATTAALLYVPFSERTLVRMAYPL